MAETRRTTKATAARTNLFVDPELWRALRVRAIEQGTTATDLLNRAIAEYVGQKVPERSKPKQAKKWRA